MQINSVSVIYLKPSVFNLDILYLMLLQVWWFNRFRTRFKSILDNTFRVSIRFRLKRQYVQKNTSYIFQKFSENQKQLKNTFKSFNKDVTQLR